MTKNVSQSKDAKIWSIDAKFQAPMSTKCKVEIAGTNAASVMGDKNPAKTDCSNKVLNSKPPFWEPDTVNIELSTGADQS